MARRAEVKLKIFPNDKTPACEAEACFSKNVVGGSMGLFTDMVVRPKGRYDGHPV